MTKDELDCDYEPFENNFFITLAIGGLSALFAAVITALSYTAAIGSVWGGEECLFPLGSVSTTTAFIDGILFVMICVIWVVSLGCYLEDLIEWKEHKRARCEKLREMYRYYEAQKISVSGIESKIPPGRTCTTCKHQSTPMSSDPCYKCSKDVVRPGYEPAK